MVKSVFICWSYSKNKSCVRFFWTTLYTLMGCNSFLQNCQFPFWGSGPHLKRFHGPTQVPQPKRHLDRFSCFCMAQSYVQQTDTWTDRTHYICSEKPHPCTLCIRCSLKLLKSRGWLLSLVDFFSPHRMQSAKMRSRATDVACYVCRLCLYVCLSVGHNSEPHRNW